MTIPGTARVTLSPASVPCHLVAPVAVLDILLLLDRQFEFVGYEVWGSHRENSTRYSHHYPAERKQAAGNSLVQIDLEIVVTVPTSSTPKLGASSF